VVGNLLILGVSAVVKSAAGANELELVGVPNLHAVDDTVWRGAAPSPEGYESLAGAGIRTVVDLRAEEDLDIDAEQLDDLGIEWIHIPIRDGQSPSQSEVDRFLIAVDGANGPVYVHCGAGVGRTGTMAAAYLTATGQASGMSALRRNLSVGPPSLEQMAFAVGLEGAHIERPNMAVVAFSRVLDAPRRLWSRYGL
jgi:protein-tyrosine phosphatase